MIIRVPLPRLRKYDVTLYKRGDTYVLHRLITVRDDHYLIRGDNTYSLEHVPDTAVIGVLTSFRYKGTQHEVKDLAICAMFASGRPSIPCDFSMSVSNRGR